MRGARQEMRVRTIQRRLTMLIKFRWLAILPMIAVIVGTIALASAAEPTPVDIQAILKKLGTNQVMSAAEEQRLTTWYRGTSLENAGSRMEAPPTTDPCPTPRVEAALSGVKPPTKEAYVQRLARLQATYGARLDQQARLKLDAELRAAARPSYGSDLGALFLVARSGSAAVYATLDAASKDPQDPVTASNLGVALKGMRDYSNALLVLLYADQLKPRNPLTLTNLAWVQAYMGDVTTAAATFQQVLQVDPANAAAPTGLGLLAQCRGDHVSAARYFRQALSKRYFPVAAAGWRSATASNDGTAGDSGASDPPISHPAGKGGGKGLTLPEPPETTSAGQMAYDLDRYADYAQRGQTEALGVMQAWTSTGLIPQIGTPASRGPGLYQRVPDKERFILGELQVMFARRAEKAAEPLEQLRAQESDHVKLRWEEIQEELLRDLAACGDNSECLEQAERNACRARRTLGDQVFAKFRPLWQQYVADLRTTLTDYNAFATPWIQDVHDPKMNRAQNLLRESTIRNADVAMRMSLFNWSQLMATVYTGCPEIEPAVPKPTGELKAWPDDPTQCRTPSVSIQMVIASFEGNCEAMKLTFGEGLFVSGEYKFGEDGAEDQITLFGGAGVAGKLGAVGAEGKIGPYVTFSGGKMVDSGLKDTASASLTVGPVTGSVGGEARISTETGVEGEVSVDMTVGVEAP